MTVVAFYISGHGFGHASRDVEIINALAARRPDVRILLRTSVAPWLLERTIAAPFELHPEPCDTGVVQIDSLRLDARATVERAREFYADVERRADLEAALLRDRGARLVLADVPPLACAAAARAGIPSIVIGNFTWDWIYAAYAGELRAAPDLVAAIRRAYRSADEAWRLPLHGGFEALERIRDVPFVARLGTHGRRETLATLGLPGDKPLALFSFGGYGVAGLDLASLDCLGAWTVVLTDHARPGKPLPGVHVIEGARIYDSGLRYEDLVAAADVVITKPGYGIVSECLANHTPMVYTSRGLFAEYPVMVAAMPRFLRCVFLDQEAILAGRWLEALETAVRLPDPPERPATNGADVIADMISARL